MILRLISQESNQFSDIRATKLERRPAGDAFSETTESVDFRGRYFHLRALGAIHVIHAGDDLGFACG